MLEAAGAEVIPVWEPAFAQEEFLEMVNNGFRLEFADYIAQVDPDGPITSLADVVAFNEEDPTVRAPFGEGYLADAAASTLSQEDYEALASQLRTEASAFIDGVLEEYDVDVLAGRGNSLASAYAMAGYPTITIPDGLLVPGGYSGLSLTGPYLSDGELIGMAFAYEQASRARTAPPID